MCPNRTVSLIDLRYCTRRRQLLRSVGFNVAIIRSIILSLNIFKPSPSQPDPPYQSRYSTPTPQLAGRRTAIRYYRHHQVVAVEVVSVANVLVETTDEPQ